MALDFPLILFCLTAATGLAWLTDRALFRRVRMAGAAATSVPGRAMATRMRAPSWLEWPAGFFPVLLAVFVVRSFVCEPFRIPSGSMMPTLEVGDFILVNKFAYGLRLPVVNREIVPLGTPERGDVVVFRYPLDPSENYVKRVVGLPGDTIVYRDKRLTINGRAVAIDGSDDYIDTERSALVRRAAETLPRAGGPLVHDVLLDAQRSGAARPIVAFPFIDACRYGDADASVTCTVPGGHYFVMGDNRDNSADSRYWGFVPDENLVGRAMFVWMNFAHPSRIGGFR